MDLTSNLLLRVYIPLYLTGLCNKRQGQDRAVKVSCKSSGHFSMSHY